VSKRIDLVDAGELAQLIRLVAGLSEPGRRIATETGFAALAIELVAEGPGCCPGTGDFEI